MFVSLLSEGGCDSVASIPLGAPLPLGESARPCRGPHRDTPASRTDSAREATKSTGGLSISGKEASGAVQYATDRGSSATNRVLDDTGRVSSAPRRGSPAMDR